MENPTIVTDKHKWKQINGVKRIKSNHCNVVGAQKSLYCHDA